MLRLRVRDGELEAEAWVYAWTGAEGVVYVGATGLHPATRTWLHLHDEDPNVGRMRARYPQLASEELDVIAVQLPAGGLLAERHVCDPPLAVEPHPETDTFVAAVAEHLGR